MIKNIVAVQRASHSSPSVMTTTEPMVEAAPAPPGAQFKEEGNAFFKAGEHLKAAAAYTKAIKLEPSNHVYYGIRANGVGERESRGPEHEVQRCKKGARSHDCLHAIVGSRGAHLCAMANAACSSAATHPVHRGWPPTSLDTNVSGFRGITPTGWRSDLRLQRVFDSRSRAVAI